jgi:hypothetical protein
MKKPASLILALAALSQAPSIARSEEYSTAKPMTYCSRCWKGRLSDFFLWYEVNYVAGFKSNAMQILSSFELKGMVR